MAGEAQTSEFLLSTATCMVGPSSKVMELSPALHSIGLVKNVQVTTTPKFVELAQGVNAQVVFSVNTEMQSKITTEVFEFTAKNLAYGAGQDPTTGLFDPVVASTTLATAITTGGASVVLTTGGVAAVGIVVGDYVIIAKVGSDLLHVGKVSVIATDTLTLATGYVMPSSAVFPTATTVVYKVRNIQVGANPSTSTFGVKLVGLMPGTGAPVTLVFPKVRIVKGMDLAFQTNDFANMPFEFTPYALLPTDNYYADFGGLKTFSIFKQL
jgi:hypothetical protein